MEGAMSWLPATWQGWAALALLVAYFVFREKLHRYLKRKA
jgi:choline-glycine betaine transporter